MNHIFICYAREDEKHADYVYNRLFNLGYDPWLDKHKILPGQNWKNEIIQAIKECSVFLALISSTSLDKRGFVQRELEEALEVLSEVPSNKVFLIPIRLENVTLDHPRLQEIQWLDFFKSRVTSFSKLVLTLDNNKVKKRIPSTIITQTKKNVSFFDVDYDTKFKTFIEKLPKNSAEPFPNYLVSFDVTKSGVTIPKKQRELNKDNMVIVLQYQYKNLICERDLFVVDLWFSGIAATISVPYSAIIGVKNADENITILRE